MLNCKKIAAKTLTLYDNTNLEKPLKNRVSR